MYIWIILYHWILLKHFALKQINYRSVVCCTVLIVMVHYILKSFTTYCNACGQAHWLWQMLQQLHMAQWKESSHKPLQCDFWFILSRTFLDMPSKRNFSRITEWTHLLSLDFILWTKLNIAGSRHFAEFFWWGIHVLFQFYHHRENTCQFPGTSVWSSEHPIPQQCQYPWYQCRVQKQLSQTTVWFFQFCLFHSWLFLLFHHPIWHGTSQESCKYIDGNTSLTLVCITFHRCMLISTYINHNVLTYFQHKLLHHTVQSHSVFHEPKCTIVEFL